MAQHDQEYRFITIEKRLDKLDQVHEIVTRLDERFDKINALYDNRTSTLEKTTENHGKDIDDLKTFKWKAMGTIGLIMVIVSVFGTAIGNALVKKFVAPAISPQVSSVSNKNNASETVQAKDTSKGGSQLIQNQKNTH